MAKRKGFSKILEPKYFSLMIGLVIFFIVAALMYGTVIISNLELKVLDLNFRLKNRITESRIQEGVTLEKRNPNISPDILIVGIDDKSLSKFGRWPFPRYKEANLVESFARIKRQNERENALFLDIFFIEPDREAEDDALLVDSIRQNGRVFLETVLQFGENTPGTEKEFQQRQILLYDNFGKITRIKGDWTKVNEFRGILPPLQPYARATYGYGHANFIEDTDKIYRKQPLVVRYSVLEKEIPLEKLTVNEPVNRENFERLAWIDKNNIFHNVPYPLTKNILGKLKKDMEKYAPLKAEDTNNDKKPDKYYYVIRKYRDSFIPAITLSLAVNYFHKKLSDVEVKLGQYIRIPSPEVFNIKTNKWEPFKLVLKRPVTDKSGKIIEKGVYKTLKEIKIPINNRGEMLVNFMGVGSSASPQEHQTFPIRSFYGYASHVPGPNPARWPRTKAVGNKIVMVGPFSKGIAEDEKPTPYGLMYGVEIHANALNTILMNKFLYYVPDWVNLVILLGAVLLTAFLVSRLSTIWSLLLSLLLIVVFFFAVSFIFEISDYIVTLSAPILGVVFSLLAVEAYRIMTEEKDKRRIKNMFGKYVSPKVVDQILDNPPELGGVDKNLTVLFSDIRGFTTLSESMTPQELVNHLNTYLTAMTDLIVLEYSGTLDKYVGDEIMCFWGAPLPQEDHAMLACECALKQMDKLRELNSKWPEERRINIGIGINSGIMTVGNMGSSGRMNYTLMGDNVNLGARLEGTNKLYKTNIIMSEFTYGLVKDQVIARELDNIRVKGKNKPVLIYELVDMKDGNV
ncbi:MAG: adenylate/guanylate cyclase domain-containing protein [Spirochaetales bacterium]|nr:adenylate/guanylate cyclase domain-containing protein [Spirochaetales bacterium]